MPYRRRIDARTYASIHESLRSMRSSQAVLQKMVSDTRGLIHDSRDVMAEADRLLRRERKSK